MKPFTWALLTAITWGLVPVFEKMGLLRANPCVGLFYRCLGVIVGLVMVYIFKGQEIRTSFAEFDSRLLLLVLGGFLASVVGQMFFYNALKNGEASKVVPIAAAYPLISFVLGILFLGEKITAGKMAGLICILVGVVLLK